MEVVILRKLIPVLVVILMLCGTALADMDVYYLDVGQADPFPWIPVHYAVYTF